MYVYDHEPRTSGSEREDLKRCEVWLAEHVDLEVLAPRQDLDQLGSAVYQDVISSAECLVHDCGEALPLGTPTVGVDVCLDETNVVLHDWADVFDPMPRARLVFAKRASLEAVRRGGLRELYHGKEKHARLNVVVDHGLLVRIGSVFPRLFGHCSRQCAKL